jgi:hypothetical protein
LFQATNAVPGRGVSYRLHNFYPPRGAIVRYCTYIGGNIKGKREKGENPKKVKGRKRTVKGKIEVKSGK